MTQLVSETFLLVNDVLQRFSVLAVPRHPVYIMLSIIHVDTLTIRGT